MGKTSIAWTDETWNPVSGCAKVSPGCKHCYAERDWHRLVHLPAYQGRAFTDVACHPERLTQPLHWQRPRMVFVNSMSDLFHEDVPDEFIDQVFAVMAATVGRHTYQILTKRPERMRAYMERLCGDFGILQEAARKVGCLLDDEGLPLVPLPLPNVWLGVTVENQDMANLRIPQLAQTPAAVRWISAEPLLEAIDLGVEYFALRCGGRYPFRGRPAEHRTRLVDLLDWVVVGGESGNHARPMHMDWARDLKAQCDAAGVSFFFKQTGLWQMVDPADDASPLAEKSLQYFPALGATFRKTQRGGSEMMDGVLIQAWPRQLQEVPR